MLRSQCLAVFALPAPSWMQEIIHKAAPSHIEVAFVDSNDTEELRVLLPQADFLVTDELSSEWLPLLQRCKLVQNQGVGYDRMDLRGLTAAGIPLAITPEGTVVGVAEHTILLMLALSKRIVQVHESMRQGEFDQYRWRPHCHSLFGKTLGIIGLGRIGRRVAQLTLAFDVQIVYSDVVRAEVHLEQQLTARYVSLDELLAEADIVTVHTPLTPNTRTLIDAPEFARMKRGAFFINTSRGETYNMDALYESLRCNHLGGAGLDVFNPEPPPPDHPVLKLPNVVCTPHMATGTLEAHVQKAEAQFGNFQRVLRGESPQNLVASA